MQTSIILSSQGQITIPAKLREQLNIKPRDILDISIDPGSQKLEITRRKSLEDQLAELDASLSPETRASFKKLAGKTASALRAECDNSPKGRKYCQGKFFNEK
jgi:looped-hinge helix DNA binding domain, AbrB family